MLEKRFGETKQFLDTDLEEPFLAEQREAKLRANEDDHAICSELKNLIDSLNHIRRRWGDLLHAKSKRFALAGAAAMADAFDDPDTYNAALDECFTLFTELEPVNATNSAIISRWTKRYLMPGAPTHWELLKASALYHLWMRSKGDKSSTFVFHMAGDDLCWIKAYRTGTAHPVVHSMWTNMKPKKIKKAGFSGEGKRGREGERRFGGSLRDAVADDDEEAREETVYESAEEIGGGNDE
ncbi:RNA-dependent RNA polymerase eukaryotic-type [Neofusicoccum parvum]|nr:RNA-dependent RNA polymerase eukaryotic-type [Neofusicoccum parvum]